VFIISSGIAPSIFGVVYDRTGSYAPALYASAVLFIAGACLLLTLGAYPRQLPAAAIIGQEKTS
jgi:cyanate permease